jgi:AraC-like DNA-binding protein/mannose-6-phosphate isomerase-like protein (cupin superfamily)
MNKNSTITEFRTENFYFLYLERKADPGMTNYSWHEHSFYEIMYFEEGENEYVIENRRYFTKEGDVLLIKPGRHHFQRRIQKAPFKLYCLGFSPELIENGDMAREIFNRSEYFSVNERSPFVKILQTLRLKIEENQTNTEKFIKSISECAIYLLSDLNIENSPAPSNPNEKLTKIIEFVKKNLKDIKCVEDIAAALFFSPSYIRSLFKKEMGIGIMEYVRNKKLLLANKRLRNGEKPTEIYVDCGFSNYPTFFRAYRAYFGYTPKYKTKEKSEK